MFEYFLGESNLYHANGLILMNVRSLKITHDEQIIIKSSPVIPNSKILISVTCLALWTGRSEL